VCVIAFLVSGSPALAQLSSVLVVSGLSSPLAVVQDPTQPNVQFIVQQGGRIRTVRDGHLEPIDFLDLTPLVLSGGERGLLGLAFAPDYATSRRFFVNYTRRPDGHTVVSRYRRMVSNPLRADGAHDNVTTLPPAFTPLTDPIAEYSHAVGNVITGGVVYRGTALGVGFFGRYFFADFGAHLVDRPGRQRHDA
jgi:Glucose / Sorbosone dehydrogenase